MIIRNERLKAREFIFCYNTVMKKYFLHGKSSSFIVDYEKDLNPEQYCAVMHESGPALVLAGAGTGKTRVVTYRVARLIEAGTRPENILLLTFTNKAATEMMRRAEKLIGRNTAGLLGGTFHHVANLLLRQHYLLAGYKQGFSILDREDSKELFDACITEIYKKKTFLPRGIVFLEICSLAKNTGIGTGHIVLDRFPHFVDILDDIEKVVALYERKKRSLNLMDFDDLLVAWKNIFAENETLREYYSLKFNHILVDEYQDTNRLQAEIIDLISGGVRNLMVVGDDAQSIYSFRGADFENILRFPERHTGAVIFKLTTNYRSTPEILYLANRIMANNRKQFTKELLSVTESGETPYIVPLKDVFQEAEFVGSVITDLHSDGRPLDRIAVLYRSHYQSLEMQMEFQRKGIPFEVRSGLKFFEQAHIKDILSYLKVVANPYDEISWKRILKLIRGIGNVAAGKLWEHIQASESPVDSLSDMHRFLPKKSLEEFGLFVGVMKELNDEKYHSLPSGAIDYALRYGYEDYLHRTYPNAEMRIEDIEQMARFAVRYDSLETFLSDLSLQGVADAEAEDADVVNGKVVLSTVHQAKGLEWDVVFVIGMNDGKFPSSKSLKSGDEEEERRLFYVGVTRAKQGLYLSYPVTPEIRYGPGFFRPSRFVRELPSDCFEEIVVEDV
jgi:DNA helicase-2/ATP-dependent DNA helicase PcrA